MSLKLQFGKKIQELRNLFLLTQESLAEKLGVSRNTIARIEKGDNFPSVETLEKIQEIFNIEYGELFNFKETSVKQLEASLSARLINLCETDIKFFISVFDSYLKTKNK